MPPPGSSKVRGYFLALGHIHARLLIGARQVVFDHVEHRPGAMTKVAPSTAPKTNAPGAMLRGTTGDLAGFSES